MLLGETEFSTGVTGALLPELPREVGGEFDI